MEQIENKRDFYNVSLKVFLKNDKGEVLILQAAREGTYKGFYDLPGGRIDIDEFETPLEEVIRREIQEEVGQVEFDLKLKPVALGRNENPNKVGPLGGPIRVFNVFFEAKYLSGEIKISPEHSSFKWLKLAKDNLEQHFKFAILEGAKMYISEK